MEIIDFHTHVFPDELAPKAMAALQANSPDSHPCTNGTMTELVESMDRAGVSRSAVLYIATKPSQVGLINKNCSLVKTSRIIPFGTLHPLTSDFDNEIQKLVTSHIPGIKFHPEYQNFYVDNPAMFPVYEALADAGLIVSFHAGKDPGPFTCDHALPAALLKIHRNFPRMTMIAAHMGGWKLWSEVEEILCGSSIYFDTSAVPELLPPLDFIRMVRKHGAEKILFGTDSPWFEQKQSREWIERMDLTEREIELILSENARRLLKV